MKAKIKIEKSFDEGRAFSKELERGDFEAFFKDEGEYLDRLADTFKEHADEGDTFTVTYTVEVER